MTAPALDVKLDLLAAAPIEMLLSGPLAEGATPDTSWKSRMADELQLAVVSVDYRLAPEAPWPLPVDDCVAAALWLARSGHARLGTKVHLLGGESAGAHLAVCIHVHIDAHR